MPGWLIIVIGVVLGLLCLFSANLFFVGMFAFGIMTSLDWAKVLFESAGINVSDLYLCLAAGIVVLWILSQTEAAGVFGGALIIVLFTIFGLLAYPGPAAFIATSVMPMLNNIVLRIAAVVSIPFLLLVIFMLAIVGVV